MSEELKWEGLWKCPACFKILPEKTHEHNVPWNKGIWCNAEMIPHDRRAPDPEKQELVGMLRKLEAFAVECETPWPEDPEDWECDSRTVAKRIRAILQNYEKERG